MKTMTLDFSPAQAYLRKLPGLLLATLLAGTGISSIAADKKPAEIEFNRQIRPILSDNCFACHGADSAARKAGLRLDRFEDAIAPRKDSKPAIVPGKTNESALVYRIHADPDDVMPPTKTHKVLTPEEKELLTRWIAEGAKYQAHWSLIAPTRPELPKVRNKSWVKNPIDQFILARLEKEKLKPAPEADRRTLARRLSLDLTGLPPKPEDVDAFVKDKSPNAYEKLVDKWMSSPQWGEHRARYWLDYARYADTHGIHFDNYREMWSYRDWVINAFNKNEPFDQFTIDQIAGDLLPNATLEQKVASGFNRCNITSNEGGLIDEEYIVLYARDRTETTAQVFLGLTAGCAVCHDHKYDRFSQREFYEMSAFFNNTTQVAKDGNIKDTPPIVVVPKPEDRSRWDALPKEKKLAKKRIEDRRKDGHVDFEKWLPTASSESLTKRLPTDKLLFNAPLNDASAITLSATLSNKAHVITLATNLNWQEGAVFAKAFTTSTNAIPEIKKAGNFDFKEPFSVTAWVKLTSDRDGALVARMDNEKGYRGWDLWIQGGRPGTHIVSKWPDNALKVVAKKAIESNRWTHVCMTYDGSAKASGVKIYIDGERQTDTEVNPDKLTKTIRTKVPLKIGQRNTSEPVENAGVQDLRLYGRALNPDEVNELANSSRLALLISKSTETRSKTESDELYTRWLTFLDPVFKTNTAGFAALEKEETQIKMRGTVAHIMQEKTNAPEAYVLFRGDYDKRRDKVSPNTPALLPPMAKDLPRNRLGFAKWLLSPEQPLTARVTVNRFWQEIFGTGIVKTSGDFGVTGEMPVHPELLDWLAVDFRESGWDIKKLFKKIVMSSTYRQAAITTPEKIAKDPENRLISRGPRFRMDAEMIRDYALSTSGLLVPKIGGPSVKPYQPDGVWEAVAMIGSNTRQYKQDSGENLYRRSLYTFWKRSAPPASMDIFNAPSRETCTVRRDRTDTPLQALAALNDPQVVEAARNLAQHALKEGGSRESDKLDFMARRLLARSLNRQEQKISESVLNDLLAHYKAEPKDAEALISVGESKTDATLDHPTLAAYTMLANQFMNLDEVLNK